MSTTRTHTCIIIGTGFSGLAMAIRLKLRGIDDFIILEKADDIGGTWRENTYPGAECDIPSALYSYSFEPYPDWEYKWSFQSQILEYIKLVAQKYDLYPHILTGKEMVAASWQEEPAVWKVSTHNGETFHGKTLVSAIGQLHHPSIPEFAGKSSFTGASWHSAQWDRDFPLSGKTVGVIGNAASAVQFIPEIAKVAGRVVVFQRSANWMLPKQDRAYRQWEKKLVTRFPILLKLYRWQIWLKGGALFFLMKKGNEALRQFMQRRSVAYIKRHLKDPELIRALTPDYPMGAKRILFSDTYYAALARPNVHLETSGIREITGGGVKTENGAEHQLDVLVYATGFKTNPFLLGLDIRGKGGMSIKDYWQDGPRNYLGMAMHYFPNLFLMYGPNTNLGSNSIILMSEAQAGYIAQCVEAILQKGWKSMEIRESVLQDYYNTTQERLKNTVWAQIDHSWYKSSNGDLPNNYPGRTMEYSRATRKVDFSKYHIESFDSNEQLK